MSFDPRAIVACTFRGAGMKGPGYCGGLKALAAMGVAPTTLVGTSAGAITAAAYALYPDADTLLSIITSADFRGFTRDLSPHVPRWMEFGLDALRFRNRGGLNSGDGMRRWLHELFGELTFSRLAALTGRDVRVWSYDMAARRPVCFSAAGTPDLKVYLGLKASATIQGIFVPEEIGGRPHGDGGIAVNDPLATLARDGFRPEQCIGLRVTSTAPAADAPVPRPFGGRQVIGCLGRSLTELGETLAWMSLSDDWRARSIEIDALRVGSTQWDISKDTIDALVQSGRDAVNRWLALQ